MKKQNNAKELAKENVTRHDITRHCEERSDEAIQLIDCRVGLRCACPPRNDEYCNGNPPTRTLPLKGGREQVSNNSGNSQSLINSNHFTHLTHSTHFTHLRKRPAFTLAEVLITLAVIGIVAAMTIPTMVQNYKKREYSTKLKKFYSTMQQVVKLSEIDNGPASQWTPVATRQDAEVLQKYWDTYFAKYLRNVTDAGTSIDKWGVTELHFLLSDGTRIRVSRPDLTSPFAFAMALCMNGDFSGTSGKDAFSFLLTKDGRFIPYVWDDHINKDLNLKLNEDEEPYTTDYTDRDNVLRLCKANNAFCTQLLFLDGWEFKDDYPLKL